MVVDNYRGSKLLLCGYPIKSTWLKAIKGGNYVGLPTVMNRSFFLGGGGQKRNPAKKLQGSQVSAGALIIRGGG